MTVSNLQIFEAVDFPQYLALPGFSYSGIKNEGKEFAPPTVKMIKGTDVHNYLLTPNDYHFENRKLIRPIVLKLKEALGPLLDHLKPEIAFTATFVHEGFLMLYKGRIDLGIEGRIVVDIKVTELDIRKAIEFFGYTKQLSGYAIAIRAKVVLIVSIHPKTLKVDIINIPIDSYFWEEQIKIKGEPII